MADYQAFIDGKTTFVAVRLKISELVSGELTGKHAIAVPHKNTGAFFWHCQRAQRGSAGKTRIACLTVWA